jgi:hypothetical protein
VSLASHVWKILVGYEEKALRQKQLDEAALEAAKILDPHAKPRLMAPDDFFLFSGLSRQEFLVSVHLLMCSCFSVYARRRKSIHHWNIQVVAKHEISRLLTLQIRHQIDD